MPISRIIILDYMVGIPTYVRNANSTAAYHVDSANTVTNAKRLNGFLESNREELERGNWVSIGYGHGGVKRF